MVAAARAGARGVHAWPRATRELGFWTDGTPAAWQVFAGFHAANRLHRKPWFDKVDPFERLQPEQLEELLFLAVSTNEAAAQALLLLIRDPDSASSHSARHYRSSCLSAAQQQRLQAALLQLPQETQQRLLHLAVQHGHGKVVAWFESWPALPQPQQEAVAATIILAAQQLNWHIVTGLLTCSAAQQLTAEQVTEVMGRAFQRWCSQPVTALAQCYEAAPVQPSKICAWLLAELNMKCSTDCYDNIQALCKMHAARSIDAEAAAGLLSAALSLQAGSYSRDHRMGLAVAELPAVQRQLDAAAAATFCMAAVRDREVDAVARACRLSAVQELSAAAVFELVEAATQHTYNAESILQLLVRLQGTQQIPPEQLAACMAALLQAKHFSTANILWSFPTAREMQAAQAAAVVKAALTAGCLPQFKVPSSLDIKAPEVTLDLFETAFRQQCSAKSVQWLLDRTSINEPNQQQLFINVLQAALHLQHFSGLQLLCEQPAAARLSPAAVLGVLQHEMQQQLEQHEEPAQQQQQHALAKAARVLVCLCNSLSQGQQRCHEAAVFSMLEVAVRLDSLKLLKELVKLKAARALDDASHEQLVQAAKQQNVTGAVLTFVERSWK